MGFALIGAVAVVLAGAVTVVVAQLRYSGDAAQVQRRQVTVAGIIAVAVGIVAGVALVAFAVVGDFRLRAKPNPEYASLAESPDLSLHGTVAFLANAKSPETGLQTCARVVSASGAQQRDVYCWKTPRPTLATVVWQPDHRLLVTEFDAPPGKNTLIPKWARRVDVKTGAVSVVAADDLGTGDRPGAGPKTNDHGERLVERSHDGDITITLRGPSTSRTVFEERDVNPDWGISVGPTWSPDFEWFLMWDGQRLLLTTVGQSPTTRVLSAEANGGPFAYDVANYSITGRAFPGS